MTSRAATTEARPAGPTRDRSRLAIAWYRVVQLTTATFLAAFFGLRAGGRRSLPVAGAAIVASNHLSHFDVFLLGILLQRPLNYVARSSLFVPGVGAFIRSVGGFPIQRDGIGAQGLKETLRRLKAGGLVLLFPEGTRSEDGELGELKAGIAVLASRAGVPVIPAAVAGSFEALPKSRSRPRLHPLRVQYGRPIGPDQFAGLTPEAMTALLRERLLECQAEARRGLRRDLDPGRPDAAGTAVGGTGAIE